MYSKNAEQDPITSDGIFCKMKRNTVLNNYSKIFRYFFLKTGKKCIFFNKQLIFLFIQSFEISFMSKITEKTLINISENIF